MHIAINLYIPGPVVRISPHELHVDDPEFYFLLNRQTRGLDKCPHYYIDQLPSASALVTSSDHVTHQKWRAAIRPLFSNTEAGRWFPLITSSAQLLCMRLQKHASEKCNSVEPFNLSVAFSSLCYDIICQVYLGVNPRTLTSEDLAIGPHRSFGEFLRLLAVLRQVAKLRIASILDDFWTKIVEDLPTKLYGYGGGKRPQSFPSILQLRQVDQHFCLGNCKNFDFCCRKLESSVNRQSVPVIARLLCCLGLFQTQVCRNDSCHL